MPIHHHFSNLQNNLKPPRAHLTITRALTLSSSTHHKPAIHPTNHQIQFHKINNKPKPSCSSSHAVAAVPAHPRPHCHHHRSQALPPPNISTGQRNKKMINKKEIKKKKRKQQLTVSRPGCAAVISKIHRSHSYARAAIDLRRSLLRPAHCSSP